MRASDNKPVSEPTEQSRTGGNLVLIGRMDRPENTGSRPESDEAIVVGTIGSAAPWFLTGWAHEVEIEFMIDTGVSGYVYSESGSALRIATLPRPAGIGLFLSPDSSRPAGVGHCVSGTML